jgi:phage minor structural protein
LLTITNNGVSEPLVDYNNFEITEEVNGDFSISFTALNTNLNEYAYPLLVEESFIEFEGHEYRVKKLKEIRNKKTVNYAQHIFFDLIGHQIYTISGGTKTLDEAVSFVLPEDWTFENVDVTESALLPNFGEDNAVALIRLICNTFDCEVKIEPNKHLKFMKQIGKDDDFQFRYKHNIKTLTRDVDTSKLATVIKGYGANGLEVTYTSPNYPVFGEIHAKPIKDDRYSVADSLTERIKRELIDYPEVSIEVEEVDLGEKKELGDKVWLIYEPLGIEFQTRIMATKKLPKQKGKNTVTLGNRKKTFSDILTETRVEIDQNNKQNQSKFNQTNDRITMEVERLDGDVTEAKAQFQIEADNISSRVEEVRTESFEHAETQATNAKNSANDYTDGLLVTVNQRVTDAESEIVQMADSITSKVDATVYETGILDTKEYAELKASEAKTDAESAANLYTDGEVAPIVTRITDAESSITQLSNEISSRVTETVYLADQATMNGKIDDVNGDVSSLGTRVYNAESEISQQATQITQRVSYTDYNGNTIVSKLNQSATTFLIEAENIRLNGITTTNSNLHLGEGYSGSKSLIFHSGSRINANSSNLDVSTAYFSSDAYNNYFTGDIELSGSSRVEFGTYGGGWYMVDSSWIRAYGNKGIYTPGEIKAGTVTQTSNIDFKENIALYSDNATNIIEGTPVYRYNHKKSFDPANWTKRKTGFVIDEANMPFPNVLKSSDDSIDLYATTSVLWKGSQEMLTRIKKMEEVLNIV